MSGKRYFVTGGGGFVGPFLRAQVESTGGTFLPMAATVDIRDADAVRQAVAEAQADFVVHLAAQSFVPDSFRDPRGTFDVNFQGTLNLLTALREIGFAGRMLFVGSGDMYGMVPEAEMPVSESRALKPRNPYAVSKVAAEALCYQWSQTEGVDVVMARPFNHIGPGQDPRFAIADFALQIARMVKSGHPRALVAGDVDAERDFTDVRDIVAAYMLLLERGRTGETYNVCSGVSRSIRALIAELADIAGLSIAIERDPERYRPAEQKRVCGNPEKLKNDTGWIPAIPMQQTLRDTLEHWLATGG